MTESSDIWTLHLVYQLSQVPQGFDEDVLRRVRAIEGVTSVAVVPSSDASTHPLFPPATRRWWPPPTRPNNASKRLSTPTMPRCGGGSGN